MSNFCARRVGNGLSEGGEFDHCVCDMGKIETSESGFKRSFFLRASNSLTTAARKGHAVS